jgi:hypothetical protein
VQYHWGTVLCYAVRAYAWSTTQTNYSYIMVEVVAQDSCNGVTYSTRMDHWKYTYGVNDNLTAFGHNNYQNCASGHWYRRYEYTQWNTGGSTYYKNGSRAD